MKTLVVLLVSAHNVAELESCLALRPEQIWLLASKSMRQPGERLYQQLQQQLPSSTITHLHHGTAQCDALTGNDAQQLQQWRDQWLQPELQRLKAEGWQTILNITGGTKLMPLVLAKLPEWDQLHYRALGEANTQIYREGSWEYGLCSEPAPIKSQLQLYLNRVKNKRPSKLSTQPDAMGVAEHLHQASLCRYRGEDHPWFLLEKIIHERQLWFNECHESSDYYTQSLPPHQIKALEPICTALNQLGDYIQLQPDRLTLPTYRHKASRRWQHFISGEWFELLIGHWLTEALGTDQIETNLQLHDRPHNSRDADLIVRHNHRLMAIELKADGHHFNAASDQLASLEKSSKAMLNTLLLFSPQAYCRIKDPDSARDRVAAASGRVGLAIDKESVIQLVQGNPRDSHTTNWGPYTPSP